jgi:hypothetical protein
LNALEKNNCYRNKYPKLITFIMYIYNPITLMKEILNKWMAVGLGRRWRGWTGAAMAASYCGG